MAKRKPFVERCEMTLNETIAIVRLHKRTTNKLVKIGEMTEGTRDHIFDFADAVIAEIKALK